VNLSKEEALDQIDKLREYVEGIDKPVFTEDMLLQLKIRSNPLKVSCNYNKSFVIRCGYDQDSFILVDTKSLQPWSNWKNPLTAKETARYLNDRKYRIVED